MVSETPRTISDASSPAADDTEDEVSYFQRNADHNDNHNDNQNHITNGYYYDGHQEEEDDILIPSYDSPERKSSVVVCTFNLVATIVGGGTFSIPLALDKCGIFLGTLVMIFSAAISYFSLYLLVIVSRKTGAQSFGEIGEKSFGPVMKNAILLLLFIFLGFVIVAYMVLVKDIWTPLLADFMTFISNVASSSSSEATARTVVLNEKIVLLFILLCVSPFVVQRTLHALRYNCYVGFASISILCIALLFNADNPFLPGSKINNDEEIVWWWTNEWKDVLFAFPIIMLSFLAQFNLPPIQNALARPSRNRIYTVSYTAIAASFVLYYLFGLGGYFFAGSSVDGNILRNIVTLPAKNATGHWLFLLGRVGCGITIMFALPMMVLPCRDSFVQLYDTLARNSKQTKPPQIVKCDGGLEAGQTANHDATNPSVESTALLSVEESRQEEDYDWRNNNECNNNSNNKGAILHYVTTFVIIFICYLGAVAAPGVAFMWSLCGSSMAYLIAFIIPASCYIQVVDKKVKQGIDDFFGNPKTLFLSWILLIISIVGAIACSTNTLWEIL